MPSEFNPYSLLSHLPLFQGMSLGEFDNVIANVRLGFSKVEAGNAIAEEGESMGGLVFILRGEAEAERLADDRGYKVVERLVTPCVLQPERLFGMTQRFSATFVAIEDCQLLTIGKMEVMRISNESQVFRLNVLNLLCTRIQRMERVPWRRKPDGIRKKIASFIENHSLRPAGRKVVSIGMVRLSREIGESRLNVSRELHSMQADGLIEMQRETIVVPHLEKLL